MSSLSTEYFKVSCFLQSCVINQTLFCLRICFYLTNKAICSYLMWSLSSEDKAFLGLSRCLLHSWYCSKCKGKVLYWSQYFGIFCVMRESVHVISLLLLSLWSWCTVHRMYTSLVASPSPTKRHICVSQLHRTASSNKWWHLRKL